jgi:hypothetical protein
LTGAYNEDSEKDEHGPHHFRRAHRHFRSCHAAFGIGLTTKRELVRIYDLAVKTNFTTFKILDLQ